MEHQSRFRENEEHDQTRRQESAHTPAAEFSSPEALLRHDAAQTPAPPGVADRLRASLAAEPVKPASWWRRLLGGRP